MATVAAGADQTAQDQLGIGDGSLTEISLLVLGSNPEGGSRVIHVPICIARPMLSLAHNKAHDAYDVEWVIQNDPSQTAGERMIKIYDITAVATS